MNTISPNISTKKKDYGTSSFSNGIFFSIGSLYPGSDAATRRPSSSTNPDYLTHFSGQIPIKELKLTYSCSGGAGGQNVNKVATKVDIR